MRNQAPNCSPSLLEEMIANPQDANLPPIFSGGLYRTRVMDILDSKTPGPYQTGSSVRNPDLV